MFDSASEYKVWCNYKLQQQAGEISALCRQVSYPLDVNGRQIGRYKCDLQFIRDGRLHVVEVKSSYTAGFRAWVRTEKHLREQYRDVFTLIVVIV